MPSYESSPAAIISQLKELLSDRYRLDDGHVSILKEIVQNADDAAAKGLVFVLLWKGVEEARNPLFHGSALVCINDGSFEARDEDAIRTLSLTSKAEDTSTIGRFGLGQKSVFHLAEAYFYLGWSKDEPERLRANVLDPWAGKNGDPGHRDWDDFTKADQDAILGRLAQWTGPREAGKGGFVLYLPLRRPEHRRPSSGGVITRNFPNVAALAGDLTTLVELGHLLPQLHHVEMIETWEVAESGPRQLASARWGGAKPRLSRPGEGAVIDRDFRGKVEIFSGNDWETSLEFFSCERIVNDPRLLTLKGSRLWPTRIATTSDNDVKQVPEPAVPHGAATIILRTDRGAKTSVNGLECAWAVFLPLSGDQNARQEKRESQWRLWLHGYFFPDSGRRHVLGIDAPSSGPEPEKEHEVRVRWNALVRDVVTLPCLLPAVQAAIDALGPDLGEQFARELARSALWQRVRAVAAGEYGLVWGPHLRDSSSPVESGARIVHSSSELVPVPRPSPDVMASPGVTAVLRALTSIERREQMIVVWDTGPRLAPSDGFHPWTERALRSALGALDPNDLSSEDALRYALQWLRLAALGASNVGRAVLELLQRCLVQEVSLGGKALQLWRDMATFCPHEHVVWSGATVKSLRDLAKLGTSVVVLPANLAPSSREASLHSVELTNVRPLLMRLGDVLRDAPSAQEEGKIAEELVARVGPRRIAEDADLRARPLLRVWSARAGTHVCRSWSALDSPKGPIIVLSRKGLSSPEMTARRFCDALNRPDADADVVLVSDMLAAAVGAATFGESVLEQLKNTEHDLASPSKRHALFRTLIGAERGTLATISSSDVQPHSELYYALRLLLHGVLEERSSVADLLVFATDARSARPQIEEELLEASGESWRLLPTDLARDLDQHWIRALGITYVTPETLVEVLSDSTGPWREEIGDRLGAENRARLRRLLAGVPAPALFKTLSIHETVGGRLTRDAPGIYLESEEKLSPRLASTVTLVKLDADPIMAAFQRQAFTSWSAHEQVKLNLHQRPSVDGALAILDALPTLGAGFATMAEALRSKAWVPTATAAPPFVCPGEVVNLKPWVEDVVSRMLGTSTCTYLTPAALSADVRTHSAFGILRARLALNDKEALDAAALQFGEFATEQANPFWLLPNAPPTGLRQFLERGSTLRALEDDLPWSLVRALRKEYGDLWFGLAQDIVKVLGKAPTAARLVALLNALAKDADPGQKADHNEVFDEYLRFARDRDDFCAQILPRIQLRDATGTWRPAGALAGWGPNLEPCYRLHDAHAKLLRLDERGDASLGSTSARAAALVAPEQRDERTAAGILDSYVQVLYGHVSREALGYFVAMFGEGSDGSLSKLAELLLAKRDAEGARLTLCTLSGYRYTNELGTLRDSRWAFRIVDKGAEVTVASLTGEALRARVASSSAADLFVERPPKAMRQARAQWLLLRRVDPNALSIDELSHAFKGTIHTFFEWAVQMSIPSGELDRFWADVARGGRALVDPTRRLVLARLPAYVTTLVGRGDERLSEIVRRIERAEQRLADNTSGDERLAKQETERLSAARRDLEHLVEQDPDVQARLVAAVRRKVQDSGYTAHQVLFELFQNADDAAAQLEEMRDRRGPAREQTRSFSVALESADDHHVLRVRHWGRRINQLSDEGGSFTRGEERGYDLDLRRMLMLHESDKNNDMTGRFGIGFKSVYLLTNAPRIRDSQLSLEIVAGFVPRHLIVSDMPTDRATAIELPLRDPALGDAALERLRSYGGLLAVFGQTLRHVEVSVDRQCEARVKVHEEARWRPVLLDGVAGLEVGELRVGLATDAPAARLLVMRRAAGGPHLVLAFKLGPRGVEAFEASVPTIWCTAPTLETWDTGFCANGPFTLDVGRVKLPPGAAANASVRGQLGDLLHESLRGLHAALDARFDATASALGLEIGTRSQDEARHGFWQTLFDRLTAPLLREHGSPACELARALNAAGRGLSGLLRDAAVLPTGLPNEHARLTRLTDVRWVLDDVVASRAVLACLSRLPGGRDDLAPGTCIGRGVAERLERLGVAWERRSGTLALKDVLERVRMRGAKLSAQVAVELWKLRAAVTGASVEAWRISGAVDDMQKHAGSWSFRARSGAYKEPSTLILGDAFRPLVQNLDANRRDQQSDEILRAGFAPNDAVLHEEYAREPQALELFLFARSHVVANVRQLAIWARDATERPRRVAVVRYLAKGALGGELRKELAQAPRWCEHDVFLQLANEAGLDLRERFILEVELFSARATFEQDDELDVYGSDEPGTISVSPAPPPLHSPRDVLKKIVDWWKNDGTERLKAYQRDVYPSGAPIDQLGRKLAARERQAWIMVMTLGACQRLGRQTSDQHRGFIELLQTHGTPRWWEVVAGDHTSVGPGQWMSVLDQWMGDVDQPDDDRYHRWFGLFPTLYRIHRYGHVYTELFLQAPGRRPPQTFDLDLLLEPKSDSALSGTSGMFDVPRLSRALGIGAPWVLRELVRLGAFKEAAKNADLRHLWPYCFVPHRATRLLLVRLGASHLGDATLGDVTAARLSRAIHSFLVEQLGLPKEAASFGNGFDLPLYLIATDAGARKAAGLTEDLS